MTTPAFPPIGDRLREARQRRGLTVRGLARAVDVSASLISQIETGKSSPSVSTLYAITAALAISIEDVFGDPAARPEGRLPWPAPLDGAERPAGPVAQPAPEPAMATAPAQLAREAATNGAARLGPAVAGAAEPAEVPPVAAGSVVHQGLRMLGSKRRVGPVVHAGERERLSLDSGVTWELLGQLPDTHVDFLRITYAPGGSSSGAGVLMRHSGSEYGTVLAGQLTLTLGFDTYVLDPGDSVSFDCSTPHAYANHGTEPAVGVWFVAERFR